MATELEHAGFEPAKKFLLEYLKLVARTQLMTDYAATKKSRRTFDPEVTARYGRPTFAPDILVKYSQKWKISRLMNFPFRGSHFRPRMLTVVVAVDGGAYINNRSDPNSRAAWAVYFGPGCYRNACDALSSQEYQTSTRAEVEAVKQALMRVEAMKTAGEFDGWREIIIKTDSDYVYKTFNDYVWVWESNGFTTKKRLPVEHAELIQFIHYTMCRFETELNLAVRYWRVAREWNKEADAMVQVVLKELKRDVKRSD